MTASTSTLEQFGLTSKNTAEMTKNTQMVTDSLSFVANKTAAGFSDMGNAMEYVGPVAHSVGMSVQETSAAIGLLSNNGIEGEKAGTALRGALSRLLKPSKQAAGAMQELGINLDAFKRGKSDCRTFLMKLKQVRRV
ncbi:phage tail tape measure protein [Lactococcus garvieae]